MPTRSPTRRANHAHVGVDVARFRRRSETVTTDHPIDKKYDDRSTYYGDGHGECHRSDFGGQRIPANPSVSLRLEIGDATHNDLEGGVATTGIGFLDVGCDPSIVTGDNAATNYMVD